MTDFIEERLTNIENHLDRIATVLERALSEHPVHADDDPGELEQPQDERSPNICPDCGMMDCQELRLAENPNETRYVCHRCGHVWKWMPER